MKKKIEKPLQDSLRDAAKNPKGWDVPGLLNDAASKLDDFANEYGGFSSYQEAVDLGREAEWWKAKCKDLEKKLAVQVLEELKTKLKAKTIACPMKEETCPFDR